MSVLSRVLRSGEGKKLKAIESLVPDINSLEPEIEKLSDHALQSKTDEFKQRLERGEDINDLLVEAFAVVREAARRVIGCLLYTSPSPRDRSLSRMPSSA